MVRHWDVDGDVVGWGADIMFKITVPDVCFIQHWRFLLLWSVEDGRSVAVPSYFCLHALSLQDSVQQEVFVVSSRMREWPGEGGDMP